MELCAQSTQAGNAPHLNSPFLEATPPGESKPGDAYRLDIVVARPLSGPPPSSSPQSAGIGGGFQRPARGRSPRPSPLATSRRLL